MNECEDVVIENITVNSNETNITKPTIPSALEKVVQLLCPNDCTFNGKCVNRSCICNKDYTAADCSISIYQRPTITRCDRNKIPHNLFLEEILINFITGPRFPVLLIFWRKVKFKSDPIIILVLAGLMVFLSLFVIFNHRIQSNGLCDRRKRPCEKTTVQGRDFLNSTNITCHIREIEVGILTICLCFTQKCKVKHFQRNRAR